MTTTLKIDSVTDVSCPWCIIGLQSLEQAADRLKGEVALDLHFQPLQLNPQMAAGGQGSWPTCARARRMRRSWPPVTSPRTSSLMASAGVNQRRSSAC